MACGYRMYSDLKPLRSMDGSEIVIDLLSGSVTQDGREVSQTLLLAGDVVSWMAERLERDGIPIGTIAVATLTLKPRLQDAGGLVIGCSTVLRTNAGILESEDVARWHPIDVRD